MCEDFADVVAAAAQDGVEGVPEGALEVTAGEATVRLHVADLGLDGATVAQQPTQAGHETAARAADQYLSPLYLVAALAAINHSKAGTVLG